MTPGRLLRQSGMASLDLTFIDKLPPAFQLAAGLVFGAGLLAWVIPRYLTKSTSPPVGDKVVLEAASIANMTPVKDMADHLRRLADAAERIAASSASREMRATEREEEEHQRELDELRRFKAEHEHDPPKYPKRPPHRRR